MRSQIHPCPSIRPRLDTHHAINLWVAHGAPRPGFIAHTLPWENLYDEQLAQHHRNAQRQRGGHWPDHLPDPLAPSPNPSDPEPTANGSPREPSQPKPKPPRGLDAKPTNGTQLVSDDLEELA